MVKEGKSLVLGHPVSFGGLDENCYVSVKKVMVWRKRGFPFGQNH